METEKIQLITYNAANASKAFVKEICNFRKEYGSREDNYFSSY